MSGPRRLLLVGGMGLAIWGMAYGWCYAVFAEHQALDGMGSSLTMLFSAAAERDDSRAESAYNSYAEAKYVYDRQVDVHSHWIGLAMLLVLIGIAFDRASFPERAKVWLAIALLLGAFVFPLGVLLQTQSHGTFPRGVAIAGSGLMILALAATIAGFAREPAAGS